MEENENKETMNELQKEIQSQLDSGTATNHPTQPSHRTQRAINDEYAQLCAQLGELHVKRATMTNQERAIMDRIQQLNDEMMLVQAEEMKASVHARVNNAAK